MPLNPALATSSPRSTRSASKSAATSLSGSRIGTRFDTARARSCDVAAALADACAALSAAASESGADKPLSAGRADSEAEPRDLLGATLLRRARPEALLGMLEHLVATLREEQRELLGQIDALQVRLLQLCRRPGGQLASALADASRSIELSRQADALGRAREAFFAARCARGNAQGAVAARDAYLDALGDAEVSLQLQNDVLGPLARALAALLRRLNVRLASRYTALG